MPLPVLTPVAGSTIKAAIGATSATSSAVTKSGIYRVWASNNCYVERGSAPTASSSTVPMSAEIPEHWNLAAGDKIAAIQMTAGETGNVFITRMARGG